MMTVFVRFLYPYFVFLMASHLRVLINITSGHLYRLDVIWCIKFDLSDAKPSRKQNKGEVILQIPSSLCRHHITSARLQIPYRKKQSTKMYACFILLFLAVFVRLLHPYFVFLMASHLRDQILYTK
jgi:hypothetical protein